MVTSYRIAGARLGALFTLACLVAGCSQPAPHAAAADSRPGALSDVQQAAPVAAPEVTLVAWVVPASLETGKPGFLQVKVLPNQPIAAGTLRVEAADSAVSIVPGEIALKDLRPPVPGRETPGRSPPPLGLVPIYTFKITAARPGSHSLVVRFAYGSKEVRQEINVKGDVK